MGDTSFFKSIRYDTDTILIFIRIFKDSIVYGAVGSSFWLGGGGMKLKFRGPSRALQVRELLGKMF